MDDSPLAIIEKRIYFSIKRTFEPFKKTQALEKMYKV
jgi:hypothetical protein